MDRQHIIYALVALLCVLAGIGFAWFTRRTKRQKRERLHREKRQSDRERLAATRMADNDGKALSSRFATANVSERAPERLI